MARIEPPNLAAWMLEHLIPAAERDEALAGDLEEHFRAGRSDSWYWRQAAAAVATGWTQYFARRRAMLVFALLWSMLAPAWYVAVNGIEASPKLDGAFQVFGPFMLVGWTALHAAFLWAGLMVYQLVHTFLGRPIPHKELRRAFWMIPLILPPVYGLAFVFAALYGNLLPDLEHARLGATSWGQIANLGVSADLIRIPYLITMVVAMWRTAPRFRPAGAASAAGSGWTGASPLAQGVSQPSASPRFFAFVVAAGVINALLCGFLLCRLPDSHSPSLSSLLFRAAIFVAVGAAAGTAGAWIYWNNPASPFRDSAPVDFRLFSLICATGFIWTPAFILFYEQITPITAFVAAIAAFALAAGLRTVPLEFLSSRAAAGSRPGPENELFTDSFLRPQFDGVGIVIALAIYGGGYAIAGRSFMTASLLLALAAFLLGWMRTVQRRQPSSHTFARAVLRLAIFILPAILVTTWALLDGIAYRNRMEAVKAAEAANGAQSGQEKAGSNSSAHGFGGYESVILWPMPQKKQIVAPLPLHDGPLAPGSTRPLVIQFDGPYWYFQPPDKRPGPRAHQAHGSPLGIRIEANNSFPLVMEAHQRLAIPIPLARCGRIDVEIENRDHNPGVVGLALLLDNDASSPQKQLYVGRQPISTGNSDQLTEQTFHFAVPAAGHLRRFNGITLMLLPETANDFRGPRVAIRELLLYPR